VAVRSSWHGLPGMRHRKSLFVSRLASSARRVDRRSTRGRRRRDGRDEAGGFGVPLGDGTAPRIPHAVRYADARRGDAVAVDDSFCSAEGDGRTCGASARRVRGDATGSGGALHSGRWSGLVQERGGNEMRADYALRRGFAARAAWPVPVVDFFLRTRIFQPICRGPRTHRASHTGRAANRWPEVSASACSRGGDESRN
jgi:hypothetical protein